MTRPIDAFESVTICCDTVQEFLKTLDKANDMWGDQEPWIYRGHVDASWELQPRLYRLLCNDDEHDVLTYTSFELDLIRRFVQGVNQANLPLPANSMGYISRTDAEGVMTYQGATDSYGNHMVFDFTHVIFALAQHFGIPTRLLSVTSDPLVAASFAASINGLVLPFDPPDGWREEARDYILRALEHSDNPYFALNECLEWMERKHVRLPSHIAVWAIRTWDMHGETSLRLLHHPYGEIPNLKAQEGAFVYDISRSNRTDSPFRAFDTQLESLINTKGIYKIVLSFNRLGELQTMLGKKNRSPLHLAASYELIAREAHVQSEDLRKAGKRQFTRHTEQAAEGQDT